MVQLQLVGLLYGILADCAGLCRHRRLCFSAAILRTGIGRYTGGCYAFVPAMLIRNDFQNLCLGFVHSMAMGTLVLLKACLGTAGLRADHSNIVMLGIEVCLLHITANRAPILLGKAAVFSCHCHILSFQVYIVTLGFSQLRLLGSTTVTHIILNCCNLTGGNRRCAVYLPLVAGSLDLLFAVAAKHIVLVFVEATLSLGVTGGGQNLGIAAHKGLPVFKNSNRLIHLRTCLGTAGLYFFTQGHFGSQLVGLSAGALNRDRCRNNALVFFPVPCGIKVIMDFIQCMGILRVNVRQKESIQQRNRVLLILLLVLVNVPIPFNGVHFRQQSRKQRLMRIFVIKHAVIVGVTDQVTLFFRFLRKTDQGHCGNHNDCHNQKHGHSQYHFRCSSFHK